jgi:uncharacterized protein
MKLLKSLAVATALAGASALAAIPAASPAHAKPDQLTVYGGPQGTSWYVLAGWLATELQRAGVRSSSELGGALSNLVHISRDPRNMGFTFAAVPDQARAGEDPFPGPVDNFCGIQIYQQSGFHMILSRDSGIEDPMDLKGKRFSGQAVGNLSQVALRHYLEIHGLSESDLDLAIGGQQFGADGVKDRRFVGFAAMSAWPSPPIMDAATSVPIRLLPVEGEMMEKVRELNSGYMPITIPAGAYPGVDEDVPTFGADAFVVMNTETSEEDQYFLTKLIHENWEGLKAVHASTRFLTPEIAANISGTDLCPGAETYWKEVGGL